MARNSSMRPQCAQTNPIDGKVVWSPVKSIWYFSLATIGLVLGPGMWSWQASLCAGLLTAVTLCAGHSVGFHRLLIHRSFECSKWLERTLVTIGTLVGMGGPQRMLYLHDIRDWAQRQPRCHPFFIHSSAIWRDWWWNLHCEIRLADPPDFVPEQAVVQDKYYRWLDRNWMLLQLPMATVLYGLGGWPWVIWGVCIRVPFSLTGHWLVGYLAHNVGPRTWHLEGHAVQGHNLPGLGLLSMGEAWHNNHHAFPDSARLGIHRGEFDPGWWFLCGLRRVGLVWNLQLPADLPPRPERRRLVGIARSHCGGWWPATVLRGR